MNKEYVLKNVYKEDDLTVALLFLCAPLVQCETEAFTVLDCGSNLKRQLLADRILLKKSTDTPATFEIFWERYPTDKESLLDYSVVDFS